MSVVTAEPRTRKSSARVFVRDLVVIVVVAVLAAFLIKTFLVRSFYIPSASMESTLLGEAGHHDRILVDELVPSVVPVQRGDVIVFSDPGGWLPQGTTSSGPLSPIAAVGEGLLSLLGLSGRDSNDHLVKRVIGLPGDHVTCCDPLGQVEVNGTPIAEPYVRLHAGSRSASGVPFDITVGADDLWVLGDNRYDSLDSRYHQDTATHGGVPMKDVVGRAFVISWPIDRWSYLSNHPETFAGVPDAPSNGAAH